MMALNAANRRINVKNGKMDKQVKKFKEQVNDLLTDLQTQDGNQPVNSISQMFPITTLDELQKLEDSINENNKQEYIAAIKAIVGYLGLVKGLKDVVVPEVMFHFNVEGKHNKMRLLQYEKFVNILYQCCYDKDRSQKSFRDELQHALRLAKKFVSKQRQKEKCNQFIDNLGV